MPTRSIEIPSPAGQTPEVFFTKRLPPLDRRRPSSLGSAPTYTIAVMSAFRATRTLLNKAPRIPESPHKYHYTEGRTPFWRKVRDILSVNPYVFQLPIH